MLVHYSVKSVPSVVYLCYLLSCHISVAFSRDNLLLSVLYAVAKFI